MGKLTVTGYAKKEVSYDWVTIKITFSSSDKSSARASKMVIEQCDIFLKKVQKKGIQMNQIRLEEDSIRLERYKEEKTIASRGICIEMEYNMPFINFIMKLIQEQNCDIEYSTSYKLSNEKEIHEQLLKEAILDSKGKAESLAASLGKKIIELKSASNRTMGEYSYLDIMKLNDDYFDEEEYLFSDELQAPLSVESEEVIAVWIVE